MKKDCKQEQLVEESPFSKGELVEYHGKTNQTISSETVVCVCCEATTSKTVVAARRVNGEVVQLVLANKYLRKHTCLF